MSWIATDSRCDNAMDSVLSALTATAMREVNETEAAVLPIVLGDALACAAVGLTSESPTGSVAADLALALSDRDLDDFDWNTFHHPGSVIIPAALDMAVESGASGGQISAAIAAGYRVAAHVGQLLDPSYRAKWHATAVCGALGAAAAAARVRSADPALMAHTLALAASAVGGLAAAPLARNGAATFTRAAAASLGVLAARSAILGVPCVGEPFTGARGLAEILSGHEPRPVAAGDSSGLATTSLRLFPVTGFGHAAVLATSMLNPTIDGITSIRVELPGVAIALGGLADHGDWWNIPHAVGQAFVSSDPFHCDGDATVTVTVELHEAQVAMDQAVAHSVSASGTIESQEATAPGRVTDTNTAQLWQRKAAEVLNVDPQAVLELADQVIERGIERGWSWRAVLTQLKLDSPQH